MFKNDFSLTVRPSVFKNCLFRFFSFLGCSIFLNALTTALCVHDAVLHVYLCKDALLMKSYYFNHINNVIFQNFRNIPSWVSGLFGIESWLFSIWLFKWKRISWTVSDKDHLFVRLPRMRMAIILLTALRKSHNDITRNHDFFFKIFGSRDIP